MDVKKCYELLKGNYNEAIGRLMSDRLIERLILKFPQDGSMSQLRDALAAQNYEDAFRAAHTLKGVAGNLAFTALHGSASELTEALRANKQKPDENLVKKVDADYDCVIATLEQYKKEK